MMRAVSMKLVKLLLGVGSLAVGGCATTTTIPDRAVFVAQIAYVATPDEAAKGFRFVAQPDEALNGVLPKSSNVPPAKSLIASPRCEHAPDARFALVRFYYYQVGRSGLLFDYLDWTMVESGLSVERGNLVEVERQVGPSNSRCMVTSKIRAASIAVAGCEYHGDQQGALFSVLDMVSGQASASLYCPFFAAEGWKSAPVGIIGGLAWWKPAPLDTR